MAKPMRKPTPEPLPESHLTAIRGAGFEVLTYQNKAIDVQSRDDQSRSEWLPENFVNWEKRLFVRWRKAGEGPYDFAGWEPQNDHHFGGRYATPQQALAWFTWLERQKP